MNILLALIPISLVLLGVAVWAFIWAVRRGQFDDMDTPALDILREDPHDRASREAAEHARAERVATPTTTETATESPTDRHAD